MNETISETIMPGTYYERNCFPEDADVINAEVGAHLVIIDDVTPKELDIATTVLMPLNEELTQEGLIKRVIDLHKNNWTILMAPWENALEWRQTLFGRTLYRRMKHFKIFMGATSGEKRKVHFFMMEKTPQFKRGVHKMSKRMDGLVGDALNAEMFKRLFCITEGGHLIREGDITELVDGDDINFLGAAKADDRVSHITRILTTVLE